MYLTNDISRALIGAFSVTTEAAMKDQQTLACPLPKTNITTVLGEFVRGFVIG